MEKPGKKNIEDILALTPMQMGMLFHYLKDPGSDYYFEQLILEICGEIRAALFEKAWNFVIETNGMLRAVFRWEKMENPLQIILKEHKLRPVYYDLSGEGGETGERLEKTAAKDRQEKFDLQDVPFRVTLCKLRERRYAMIVSNHHILYDGWSSGIILRDFFNAYDDLSRGRKPALPGKTKFKEFIKGLQEQDTEQQEQYWKNYLQGSAAHTELPIKRKTGNRAAGPGNYSVVLPRERVVTWEGFIEKHRITLAPLLYGAWGLLLQRYRDSGDVVFGTTVSGRPAKVKGIEEIVGLFINTVPLRVRGFPRESAADFVYRVHRDLLSREAHEAVSPVKIKEYSGEESTEELFDTIVVLENYPLDRALLLENSNLSVDSYRVIERTHYDLTVAITLFEGLRLNFIYNKGVFEEDSIVRMAGHFITAAENIVENAGQQVFDIDIIPGKERNRLLYEFNNAAADFPKDKTSHELFGEQAERTPEKAALVCSRHDTPTVGGEERTGEPVQLTYRQLNEKSGQLAHYLRSKGAGPAANPIVGLLVDRRPEMIVGILGILKAGCAYVPLNPGEPRARLKYILEECSSSLLLTVSTLMAGSRWFDFCIYIDEAGVTGTGDMPVGEGKGDILPTHLAYAIFTSGTTGKPKGVPIKHANLSPLLHWGYRHLGIGPTDRVIQNLSYYFDWSVWEIFITLTTGACLYMVSEEVLLNPGASIDFIDKNEITVLHVTPTQYRCYVSEERKLETLKYLFIGAEKLTLELVRRSMASVSGMCRIFNMYGPTEATIIAAVLEIRGGQEESFACLSSVPIGVPVGNTRLLVLDKHMRLCPVNVVGELYVGGDGVALGYLNNPGLTAERFLSISYRSDTSDRTYRSEKIYKTGDLVRWLPDGNMEFLERLDHQVKIRGFRIEPGEIEKRLMMHEQVKEAVVIARDDHTGEKYLCAYIVPAALDVEAFDNIAIELREYLSQSLPNYMIPAYFVILEKIPLAAAGKIDRKALPEPEIVSTSKHTCTAPRDRMEKSLLDIWHHILGIDKERIGIDDNFFHLGGHSLKAVSLTGRIHKEFNIKLSISEVFKTPTIRGLARYITKTEESIYLSIEPAEKKEYYAMSSAQKRLFVLQQMDETTTAYNMCKALLVEGELEKEKLEGVFRELIARHESLRTSFAMPGKEAVQRIHEFHEVEFEIEFNEQAEKGSRGELAQQSNEIIKNFVRPFDLSKAPLLRAGLIKEAVNRHILVVDMHHIVSDGRSIEVIEREFQVLLGGGELPELSLQYKDFCLWQSSRREQEFIKQQEAYWLKEFGSEAPLPEVPLDFPRPETQSFEGNILTFKIGSAVTAKLRNLAAAGEATLYMVLLSAVYIFLARISGQEEIVVGTPVSGRRHPQLETVMGMFVNTLALRGCPAGEKTYREFLREIKERAAAAFENQDYPFDDLVDRVVPRRDFSRNALFDVMFVLQNSYMGAMEIRDLKLTPYPFDNGIAKLDLVFNCEEDEDGLYFTVQYSTKLFKRETVEQWIVYFQGIIGDIPADPGKRLADIEIMTAEEKKQVLFDFNGPGAAARTRAAADFPKDKTIPALFEEQAAKTPDRVCLVGAHENHERKKLQCPCSKKGQGPYDKIQTNYKPLIRTDEIDTDIGTITYRELNRRANRLAQVLKEKGVRSDIIVGIKMERSVDMIIGIWGILKAGGAYLPIEPGYPQERIDYMVKDSGAEILLASSDLSDDRCSINLPGIHLHHPDNFVSHQPSSDGEPTTRRVMKSFSGGPGGRFFKKAPLAAGGNNKIDATLAYVIYTSGSTGKPKGVLVEHRSVVNILTALQRDYPLPESGTYLLKTTYVFDVSVTELFGWFLGGGRLAVPGAGTEKDPAAILTAVEKYGVTHINFVPSMFNAFLEVLTPGEISKLAGLEYIFLAGEALLPGTVHKFRDLQTGIVLENIYGPTEGTVYSSRYSLSGWRGSGSIPIGGPLQNVRLLVLNRDDRIQPVGVPGELAVSGTGLARGYLNKPELTAEKFVSIFYRSYTSYRTYSSEKIYKTGDLVRWLADGNLEFLGRMDLQVKIRGFRIELEEIENRLLLHRQVKEAVVIARQDRSEEKYLCAYIVPGIEGVLDWSGAGLREYLSRSLPDYMVPAYFVMMEKMPVTAAGKIHRKALPEPETIPAAEYTAPRDRMETLLSDIWRHVLATGEKRPGIDDNFFHLGGHSLKTISLIGRIHKEFNIKLSISEVFKIPTIRGLARYIKKTGESIYLSIEPAEKKEYYALSSAQKRLFIIQQMDETTTAYNMCKALRVEGELEKEKLEGVFRQLIARHESLRTSFAMPGKEAVQRIHEFHEVEFEIEYHSAERRGDSLWPPPAHEKGSHGELPLQSNEIIRDFLRPFDLSRAPLLRVGLIKEAVNRHILVVDMHHIVSDGRSIEVIEREFPVLLGGGELPEILLQYKDFCLWQSSRREQEFIKQQEAYWLKEFGSEAPLLEVPLDFPRPETLSFEGNILTFKIGSAVTAKLRNLAAVGEATLYMVLLSAVYIFLARISGREEIVVGTPVSGRRHPQLDTVMGMFVNTLALRGRPAGEKTYREFLREIKERAATAFENQDYPFDDLVDRVVSRRDFSRNALFDVMFVLQNSYMGAMEIRDLKLTPYPFDSGIAMLDLVFNCEEDESGLYFTVQYSTKLFKRETVEQWLIYFQGIIGAIPGDPGKRLADIEIMTAEEKKQVLFDFNGPGAAARIRAALREWYGDESPVGEPTESTKSYILDKAMKPQPVHAAGDWYLGGTGFSGENESAASPFVDFVEGERLYRTGARARWLPDGTIMVLRGQEGETAADGWAAAAGAGYAAPRDGIEKKLVEIWSEVLGIEKDRIGIDANFFDSGGHSFSATTLAAKIHKELETRVTLVQIFKKPHIRGIAGYIRGDGREPGIRGTGGTAAYAAVEPVEEKEYYPLSSAQQRLFLLYQVGGAVNTVYNLPNLMEVTGKLDKKRFEQAFHTLIRRHESLRTSFHLVGEESVQRIHEEVEFEIEYYDLTASSEGTGDTGKKEKIQNSFIRLFDLAQAPLLRVGLAKLEPGKPGEREKHLLICDMHHIISDAASMRILVREFMQAYEGKALPGLSVRYRDFTRWQDCLWAGGMLDEQERYWRKQFPGEIPVLDMPTDFPRPAVQGFEGSTVTFYIDRELTAKIKDFLARTDTTLFMATLAAYFVLLHKYTEQQDIVVGIAGSGRNHPDIENVIGIFINTLAIRGNPAGDKTFTHFLEEVKAAALGAYDNQDYPFDTLVDRLGIPRDFSRNPLLDVLFVSENVDAPDLELEGATFKTLEFTGTISHVDMILYIHEEGDALRMMLEYSTALFKAATAKKIARRYIEILEQVAANPRVKLGDIEIPVELSDADHGMEYDDFVEFDF